MTKKELKYVNSLKEENERVKTLLMRFVDALGKLRNIDDAVSISLIPLMTEQNQKFRAEVKAEAYKEFAELAHCHCQDIINQPHNEKVKPLNWKVAYEEFDEYIDNLLKEIVGNK